MARKPKDTSIRLEARQENGEWWVRNAFVNQNVLVLIGEKPRSWLIDIANSTMIRWAGFDTDKPLRITGGHE